MAESKINKPLSYTSGTDGIWTYRKYDDGTYHAWYEGTINLSTGTLWSGGFYHHLASSYVAPPSFSTNMTSFSAFANSGVIMLFAGHDTSGNMVCPYFATSSASSLSGVAVRYDMHGKWR